jgi:hypothetical protein
MVIEGFRGSSGGGSIGGGGGAGGHDSQLSFSGVGGGGRPSATGFQHQVQPSSNFDRYNSDRDRDRNRDHDRNNNNNVIHVGGGGGGGGYDRNHWNGYYPPYNYYNPLMYQDRQPTEIVINEDKNKPNNKMDETVKILLIVFICMFALVMLFVMLNYFKK